MTLNFDIISEVKNIRDRYLIVMNWTEAQKKTIETREKNILVSAAAGSGKTAVLIERIKQLVLKDKIDIDRFLITTFTNAASVEMKERLEKAIKSEFDKEGADRNFLKKQLNMIPIANISTFHTFALEIMKHYFYLTDLEPGFRIGDEIQVSILKNEAIDIIFERRFSEDYERFKEFLKKYSSDRSEKKLKQNIVKLYDEIRSIPHYFDWAENRCKLMRAESPSKAMGLRAFVAEETKECICRAAEAYEMAAELIDETGLCELSVKAYDDTEKIRNILRRVADGSEEDIGSALKNLKFNRMSVKKDQQEIYNEIKEKVSRFRKNGKKLLDDLRGKYYAETFEEYDLQLRSQHDDTEYFIGLMRDFEEAFSSKKSEKNMVDFDDVMHYAIDILNDPAAAEEYREKFLYIFIDEFQDSNMLQEEIIGRISRENNLFMVGDVKQSIYKFRLAEPEIFRRKYELYKNSGGETSIKIDLNSNFRSKRSVTETVNAVFADIMDGYDDDAKLHCRVEGDAYGFATQLHIIDKAEGNDGQEEFVDSIQAEAALVAELIKENMGISIYDSKLARERKTEYKDIVVLSRSRSTIAGIERYLNNEGIPAYGENSGGYFEAVEIQVFINLLKIIDNTRQDIPLISAMRSVVFGFTAKDLAAIRIFCREGSFFKAVKAYACEGEDMALRQKIIDMREKLSYWKEIKNVLSLEELVRILVYNTGYYDYCSGLPLGKQRTSNLKLLIEKAASFEKGSSSGLYGFLSYVEAMKAGRISAGEAKIVGDNENVVRVMTVHKSKGLEFPIVILTGIGREIKFRGSGGPAMLHKDFAIGLPFVCREEHWHKKSLLQRVIEGRKAKENIEEEVRILYVALTRAKDGILMTGVVGDAEKLNDLPRGKKSFLDMVYGAVSEKNEHIVLHRISDMQRKEQGWQSKYERYALLEARAAECRDEQRMKQIDRLLSFEYPYGFLGRIKRKYSVTELNTHEPQITGNIFLKKPVFAEAGKKPTAAEIGTMIHLIMEKTDFKSAAEQGKSYISNVIDRLISDGRLNEDDIRYINTDNIYAFFENDIGRRAAGAKKLEKEREFILRKNIDGADTIVQGIIDCYFEEDGEIVLIDYKNSHVGAEMEEKTLVSKYRDQISIYKEALRTAEGMEVKAAYLYLFNLQKFIKAG